jgi:hypothetical protein
MSVLILPMTALFSAIALSMFGQDGLGFLVCLLGIIGGNLHGGNKAGN